MQKILFQDLIQYLVLKFRKANTQQIVTIYFHLKTFLFLSRNTQMDIHKTQFSDSI